jgi:Smg protein
MKTNNILSIVMYLMHHHQDRSLDALTQKSEKKLSASLEKVGFLPIDIEQAFAWLQNLSYMKHSFEAPPSEKSFRAYSHDEKSAISTECHAFLLQLEAQHIITPMIREVILEQLLQLDEHIDLSLMKWVVLVVLFHLDDDKEALSCMEFLVLEDSSFQLQ